MVINLQLISIIDAASGQSSQLSSLADAAIDSIFPLQKSNTLTLRPNVGPSTSHRRGAIKMIDCRRRQRQTNKSHSHRDSRFAICDWSERVAIVHSDDRFVVVVVPFILSLTHIASNDQH